MNRLLRNSYKDLSELPSIWDEWQQEDCVEDYVEKIDGPDRTDDEGLLSY